MEEEQGRLKEWRYFGFMAAKLSFGCIVSILIAYELGLKYNTTAGVITILSIQNTKAETLKNALRRLMAFIVAMAVAKVSFSAFGYTTFGFGAFLFVYVFFCISIGWEIAMSVNTVLASHLLAEQAVSWDMLGNETLLLIIGTAVGIVMNLHLRQDKKTMRLRMRLMDEEIKNILRLMAQSIKKKTPPLEEEHFYRLEQLVFRAQQVALKNYKNTFVRHTTFYVKYLEMRKEQTEILYEMHRKIRNIEMTPVQAGRIADFLEKVSDEYEEKNQVKELLEQLDALFFHMQKEELPTKRREFESRAVLYVFMLDIREFLKIKHAFARMQLEKAHHKS